jgi:Domain of Unknown Function with PDB structure (DUF3857)
MHLPMKQFSLCVACILLATRFSFAQQFPGYGIISSQELNLTQVDFDKDANAVVLIHEAFSNYDDQRHLITYHHIRIKILKEKGFSFANVSIPFYRKDDFELIRGVEGMTINLVDGTQVVNTKLDRKSIFTQKTNDRIGEVVFTFPAIKVGSIIDYTYQSDMKSYGGLEDWDFQERIPVLISKYSLVIAPNIEFAYRVNKTLDLPIVIKRGSFTDGVYFEMKDIPGLGDEPYMDARRDYVQKIIFQLSGFSRNGSDKSRYMTSWEEVSRELNSSAEFGGQLDKNISGTEDFMKLVKAMNSPEERMKAVFNYVRSNMVWNNLYSKYSTDGVKNALQKKTGTSGDINLLLVNLLKEASLEAYPMLVSERFHGKVNSTYPFIDQFNSVFAYVIVNKKKYYLDATDKTNPPHLTPSNILNTTAFIVNRKAGGLTDITNDTAQYKEYITAALDLSDKGAITGTVTVRSKDYARFTKLPAYKADKEKFIRHYYIVDGTNFTAKDFEVSNIENDSMMFDQDFKVSGTLNTTGDYTFLPLNLYTGFDFNPFLSDNRFSNINFGFRRSISLNLSVQLPANYAIDEMPRSVRLTNPDKDISFLRQIEFDKETNFIRCMISIEFTKSLYETDTYPIIKEIYQKMFEFLKEPVVLKKK